jgi:serine O-acetyltransferase
MANGKTMNLLYLISSDFEQHLRRRGCYSGGSAALSQKLGIILTSRGFWAMVIHRLGAYISVRFSSKSQNPLRFLFKLPYFMLRQFILVVAKIHLEKSMPVGPGLYLADAGEIIIGAHEIGANCEIGSKVTIGIGGRKRDKPKLGNNVVIGSGSIVFGGIVINDNVTIAPNSICSKTIPAGCLVCGNPARIVGHF